MQLLLQYQSFPMTWKWQPLCMSIQNGFDCIRTVKIRFTTKTFGLSKIPSRVSHEAEDSTAGIKDLAGIAGTAPTKQTGSGSSQSTCLADKSWLKALSHNTERACLSPATTRPLSAN